MIETEFGVLNGNNSVINRIEMPNVYILYMGMSEVRKITPPFSMFYGLWCNTVTFFSVLKIITISFSSHLFHSTEVFDGIPRWFRGKESACGTGDAGLIPGLGRSPGEGNSNPCQYSCLGNPLDRETWWASVGLQRVDTTWGRNNKKQ